MLSSGSGAFGVSSAMAQPPGFTDSPEGTSPDQGRRKRGDQRPNTIKALASFGPWTPRGRRSVCGCRARRIVQSSVRLTPFALLTEPSSGTGTIPNIDYGDRVARVHSGVSRIGVQFGWSVG